MRGEGSDAALVPRRLEASAPAPRPIALEAVAPLAAHAQASARQWPLRRARARDEAERARRHALAVAPAHRLVARRGERAWPATVRGLDQRARDAAARRPAAARHVSEADRHGLRAVGHAVPAVWHAQTTTPAERTHGLRGLMQDVLLPKGALAVPRPTPASVVRRTAPAVLERLAPLSRDHPDIGRAECLHQEGSRSGQGGACTASKGHGLR